jgi:hypothetical protein
MTKQDKKLQFDEFVDLWVPRNAKALKCIFSAGEEIVIVGLGLAKPMINHRFTRHPWVSKPKPTGKNSQHNRTQTSS